MTTIKVIMKKTGEPVKDTNISISLDNQADDYQGTTNQNGILELDHLRGNGSISVGGRSHYSGIIDGEILLEIWSLNSGVSGMAQGAPSGIGGGSIAYPSMQTDYVMVADEKVMTCSEGYIMHPEQWSEAYVEALAAKEGLELTSEHWEIVAHIRDYYDEKNVQCTVRDMIKHFRKVWGKERGSNRYLHKIFPRGGPQKQGNRLAGLLRTKGEH